MPKRKHPLILLLLGVMTGALSLWACSVPVFRYALEKWPSDSYRAMVTHDAPLTDSQKSLVEDLGKNGRAGTIGANIASSAVAADPSASPSTPRLTVRYPSATRLNRVIWEGPLTQENVARVLESPARTEIIDRLAEGESAVWVLLECGDRAKDDAAALLLQTRLDYLGTTLQLPKLDAQDVVNGLITIPEEDLRLAFSKLRLSRTKAEEEFFVKMLLNIEADLGEVREPIVIPIFGRGRALYALVGDGIKRETIDQAATFLIGKCSCQVKEQNPGVDLLLAADWEKLLKVQATAPPDLPTLAELSKASPVTVTIGATSSAQTVTIPLTTTTTTVSYSYTISALPIVVAAGLILAGFMLWFRK